MPSLFRLLMVLGLLGGFAYGAMFALATFVQPQQRDMTISIPAAKLNKAN
ncbi:MAG: histidine kinase [Xanthobacteraceae bacterium]|nr:histidine kinase [Xanthobacteraceae bacterium]